MLLRRPRLIALIATALAVGAFLALRPATEGEHDEVTVTDPAGASLTLPKPDGWKELRGDELEKLPGDPLTVLRRDQGDALVVVNVQQGRADDFDKLSRGLDRRLERKLSDFRKVSVRRIQVEAGRALLYSYALKRKGTAHTLIVVPAGNRNYTLNAVVPAGAQEAAREVGRILHGFDA